MDLVGFLVFVFFHCVSLYIEGEDINDLQGEKVTLVISKIGGVTCFVSVGKVVDDRFF